jgi:uncharacterized protein
MRILSWQTAVVPIGGILEIMKEWGDVSPHWLVYFGITDCGAGAENALALGGDVLHGPMDIPNVGRFALVSDPQGAVFAIFEPISPNL